MHVLIIVIQYVYYIPIMATCGKCGQISLIASFFDLIPKIQGTQCRGILWGYTIKIHCCEYICTYALNANCYTMNKPPSLRRSTKICKHNVQACPDHVTKPYSGKDYTILGAYMRLQTTNNCTAVWVVIVTVWDRLYSKEKYSISWDWCLSPLCCQGISSHGINCEMGTFCRVEFILGFETISILEEISKRPLIVSRITTNSYSSCKFDSKSCHKWYRIKVPTYVRM